MTKSMTSFLTRKLQESKFLEGLLETQAEDSEKFKILSSIITELLHNYGPVYRHAPILHTIQYLRYHGYDVNFWYEKMQSYYFDANRLKEAGINSIVLWQAVIKYTPDVFENFLNDPESLDQVMEFTPFLGHRVKPV